MRRYRAQTTGSTTCLGLLFAFASPAGPSSVCRPIVTLSVTVRKEDVLSGSGVSDSADRSGPEHAHHTRHLCLPILKRARPPLSTSETHDPRAKMMSGCRTRHPQIDRQNVALSQSPAQTAIPPTD